jgi:hypothetical protein
MSTPDPATPDPSTPDPATPDRSPEPAPPGLPPAPWILLDRITADQTTTVLDWLEQWLAGAGRPDAVEACAAACSLEQDDAFSVAAWVGALAARLQHRIDESDSFTDTPTEPGRHPWS